MKLQKILVPTSLVLCGAAISVLVMSSTVAPQMGPTRVQARDDVAALRSELAGMRAQLKAQAGQAALGASASTGAQPVPVAAPEPDASERAPTFAEERVDPEWARDSGKVVRQAFTGIAGAKMESVECKELSCRATYRAPDSRAARSIADEVIRKTHALAAAGGVDERGAFEVTLVLREPGESPEL
jgi:hypothetical protein